MTRRIYSGQLLCLPPQPEHFCRLGLMLSLMEDFAARTRFRTKQGIWGTPFAGAAAGADCLVPLSVATLVIVFGHQIETWMVENANGHELRHVVLSSGAWYGVDCLVYHVTVLAALYTWHEEKEHWFGGRGAVAARFCGFRPRLLLGVCDAVADTQCFTFIWRRIATLVWLYITAFSVLVGAELNGFLWRSPGAALQPDFYGTADGFNLARRVADTRGPPGRTEKLHVQ